MTGTGLPPNMPFLHELRRLGLKMRVCRSGTCVELQCTPYTRVELVQAKIGELADVWHIPLTDADACTIERIEQCYVP